MKRIVLDLSRRTPTTGVTRAAADAVSKEGKGTKEVDVPLDVIPDLPARRPGPVTGAPATEQTAPPAPRSRPTVPPVESIEDDPDEALARRAALGDKDAFTALADRHGPALHRHLSRMLADAPAVEDCLQETLLAAWRGLPGFRGEAGVKTWLFSIARRQVFAHSRKAPPAGSLSGLDPADVSGRVVAVGGDPAGVSLDAALLRAVEDALRLLPEQQRSAWLLKEVEGLTYLQIAEVLEVGPAAVRGLLARARVTLSAALQGWR